MAIAEEDTKPEAGVPWFPASDKTKDPRHRWFVENYGAQCWELDALSPVILRERIEDEILVSLDWMRGTTRSRSRPRSASP